MPYPNDCLTRFSCYVHVNKAPVLPIHPRPRVLGHKRPFIPLGYQVGSIVTRVFTDRLPGLCHTLRRPRLCPAAR